MVDLSKYRKDFPILERTMHGKPLIYFDSAATAQKPSVVIDTIADFYRKDYGTVHRAVYDLSLHSTKEYQEAREKVRRFINAEKSEEIIFTRGTTESINLVANSFGKAFISPGDEVLITEMEHHSNIVPWQMCCQERGATLKVVPMDDRGVLDLKAFQELLTEKTKIVAFAHVSNALGTLNPVKAMIKMAHEKGAKVLVDGAQSAPHLRVDVQDLDADFYVFSGHKVYGPTGIGILYGKEELLNAMPPYQGGGDMIEKVTFPKTTYNVLPLKFEAGTPMIAEVIGIGAAIDYVNSIGLSSIHQWEQKLLAYATKRAKEIPFLHIIGEAPEKSSIISFIMDGIHPLDIGTMLDLKGIAIRTGHHCAQPVMQHFHIPGTARASFGLYNTEAEIDQFIQALKEIIPLFK